MRPFKSSMHEFAYGSAYSTYTNSNELFMQHFPSGYLFVELGGGVDDALV